MFQYEMIVELPHKNMLRVCHALPYLILSALLILILPRKEGTVAEKGLPLL